MSGRVVYVGDKNAADIEAMAPQLVWQALGDSDLPKIFIPKATDLRRIETLPVLGSGKIDLRAVKALAVTAE